MPSATAQSSSPESRLSTTSIHSVATSVLLSSTSTQAVTTSSTDTRVLQTQLSESSASSDAVIFTDVSATLHVSSVPCYQLPVPTASMRAVALNTVDPSLSGIMYIGTDGKAPLYFADTDDSGTSYILNVIDSESFSITEVTTGDSLLVDRTGLHVYPGACDLAMDIHVGNFFEQVRQLSKRHAPLSEETHVLEKRGQDPFDVSVSIKDQCGQLTPLDPVPEVFLGPSECSFVRGQGGVYNFTCNYPGEESLAAKCELYVDEIASGLSTLVILAGFVAQFLHNSAGQDSDQDGVGLQAVRKSGHIHVASKRNNRDRAVMHTGISIRDRAAEFHKWRVGSPSTPSNHRVADELGQ
ncbi:hypothetical protein S40293_06583 [Stachybotrys chartarum IBT 40293]|nr:hypothetical protein S40293_06583 [Stachybotrys chartarum IBT 40293]